MDATEPFPAGLFRAPIPNDVFGRMSEMSDSALRSLLALIHLSFRFDPVEQEWTRPDNRRDWFARGKVEEACGLSSQGTRNGLEELESMGWARVDRTGRCHRYRLRLEVPTRRFTYVPTVLLENAGDLDSATELRIVLAVLRQTWGWTDTDRTADGGRQAVHVRWTRASTGDLADATGRSETAVARAAKALQGRWIERARPGGNGPYQYRFLPEAIGDGSGDEDSFCGDRANDLAPDRQNSDPSTSNRESYSRDKHGQSQSKSETRPEKRQLLDKTRAVPSGKNPESKPAGLRAGHSPKKPPDQTGALDLSALSPKQRKLAQTLQNVGVWTNRIADLLTRFSSERIRANVELYRRRAAEQPIRAPGAWLYTAITDGYALPTPSPEPPNSSTTSARPPLDHKQTVSREEKDAYVAEGVSDKQFHRCLSGRNGPDEPRFMYFDPEIGGPTRRPHSSRNRRARTDETADD